MPGRLDEIENMLRSCLGGTALRANPELVYAVNTLLMRFLRTPDSLCVLWHKLDSMLFNTVYLITGGTMVITKDDGQRVRVTSEQIRDLADRLLALSYRFMNVSPTLEDALYDLSRNGSYAAMRELTARYPMDDMERRCILQVLEENGQAV